MAHTNLHKDKAKYKADLIPATLRYLLHSYRHNSERSFFVQRRNKIRYRFTNNDLQSEIYDFITRYTEYDDEEDSF